MSRQHAESVRIMREQDILRIAKALPYRTSCPLNWSGVEVHRYRMQPHESPEHAYPQLAVFLFHASSPVHGEIRFAGAKSKMTAELLQGSVSIAPPGLPFSSKHDAPHEVTSIFLDPFTVAEMARTETGLYNLEVLPQYGIRDALIEEIARALDSQLMLEQPGPRIYPESLASALAAHVLAKYSNQSFAAPKAMGLTRTQLRRSLEFLHENLDSDLSLGEIAAVANMSKYHFAKSFRQAVGIAPHRYLVKLRVDKARKLLTSDCLSVEEVATRVGYSDKSHFTTQFRKIVGTTPHRYRRGF